MVLTNATTGAMCVAADIWLFRVVVRALFTKKRRTHIVAPLGMQLVLQASSKVERNPIIEIGSLGSKKCAFACHLTFFTSFKI